MTSRHASRTLPVACASFASLLLAAPAHGQQVIEVGTGPGMLNSIKQAYALANSGDTILVADGYDTYSMDDIPLVLAGKSVQIVSAGHSTISGGPDGGYDWTTPLIIRDLGPDQSVVLRGFDIDANNFADFGAVPAIIMYDCAGPVVFEDCTVEAARKASFVVDDCSSVTFTNCTINSGMFLTASQGFFYDTHVAGSEGSLGIMSGPPFNFTIPPSPGGAAVRLASSSTLYAAGGSFTGGHGGSPNGYCFAGADGGPGLGVADDLPCTIRTRDTTILGGDGSRGQCGEPDGSPSPPVQLGAGSVHTLLTGTPRSFSLSSLVHVGGDLALTFDGEPGDSAFLVLAALPSPGLFLPVSKMMLHLAPPLAVVALGTLPTGDLAFDLSVPSLPPGVEGLGISGQGYFQPVSGLFHLTGPSTTTIVSP